MDKVSDEEWDQGIKEIPLGKAPGESGLSGEIIKNLKTKGRAWVRRLADLVITKQVIPLQFKCGVICPIPKKDDWGGDINNTRPITLLECLMKFIIKIVTKRITRILVENKILTGYNFFGTDGKCTNDPIKIVNMAYEEARQKNKPLYILYQDMRRAFDCEMGNVRTVTKEA